ncbi:hypothetical protein GCM10009849_18630 [Sinomonas flava]|uniref:Uncharacterized protein n=1 Tax=Sinomonas flava TaxID=496857 RepID=A0ABN3BTC5_9MICC
MRLWQVLGLTAQPTKEQVGREAAAERTRREIAAVRQAAWADAVARSASRDAIQEGTRLNRSAGTNAIGRPKLTRSRLPTDVSRSQPTEGQNE